MQRQRVTSPRSVLPLAEVAQDLGAARLAHQSEVIEPQFLEAAPESPVILDFSRDEQAPAARRVARKIYVSFLRIVEPRREHIDRPASGPFMKYPKLAPALERLHRKHQRRTLRDRPYRGHPHHPVRTAPDDCGGARPMCILQGNTRFAQISRRRAESQWSGLRCGGRPSPADRTDPQHGVHVLRPPVITQIIWMHGKKLRERALRRRAGGLAAAVLAIGKRGPNHSAPRMQAAAGHCAQFAVIDLLEQLGALSVEGCAQDGAQIRIDAIGPREAEDRVRALLRLRPRQCQNPMKQFAVVADSHPTVALEIAHANAELFYDFQVWGEIGEMLRTARGLIGEPLGHLGYASKGSAVMACDGTALRYAAP